MATTAIPPEIEIRSRGLDLEGMRRELLAGLGQSPRSISSKYFYDQRGSLLFEEISTLAEYYPTRIERGILQAAAGEIAELTGATQMVELGSGVAEKTRILLSALLPPAGDLECYVPFDVSEEVLRRSASELTTGFPGLRVHAIVGDFNAGICPLPRSDGPRLLLFLGSTIGNLDPETEVPPFLSRIAEALEPGDWFLLGTDLVKDPKILEAAYNDRQGITAEFNRNILRVVNELLEADFAPERFGHRAFWDSQRQWIEMRLVARERQIVRLQAVAETLVLEPGEAIRTEISAKYRPEAVDRRLSDAGLETLRRFTDSNRYFALTLAGLATDRLKAPAPGR